MAPRLNLPAKKLRATLQFLTEEHLVNSETVDDLAQGGSQATRFYYIDYNRAVHSIRLRLHLLKRELEKEETRARSSSFFLCPGYDKKRCNGKYTEEEAQQVLDVTSGLFLCQECARMFENDPTAPPKTDYTLQLVDNANAVKLAVNNLRRLNVQMTAKFIGNQQLRPGIYHLLQKVRGKGKPPITSNLPSENYQLGIGSTRLAGTGRTAGNKATKMHEQGYAESIEQARKYLVGAEQSDDSDLMFLKNAMGQKVQFSVERGGGNRAQILASARRRQRKLMDAAATRVGAALPIQIRVEESRKRKIEEEKARSMKKTKGPTEPDFLEDNIGRGLGKVTPDNEYENEHTHPETLDDRSSTSDSVLVLIDDFEEHQRIPEQNRIAGFQSHYKMEMDRQVRILSISESDTASVGVEESSIIWEDGDAV